jgi:ABC-type nitrate/sulfonate/bicarbonate transport system substrate-binding protein
MTQAKTTPVRFVYRSESMVPLLTIMDKGGLWEREGIDVKAFAFSDDPIGAEEQLLDGGIDFIFGNHVTPYMRLAQGHQMVCLAQTENWMHQWIATAPHITDLSQLKGKRMFGVPLFGENGKFTGHANGNRILILELAGADTKTMEFLPARSVPNAAEAVRDGKADACWVSPDHPERAQAAGLKIWQLKPLPMVHSITYTTSTERLQQKDGLEERLMKVLVDATHFLKTKKVETLEMMKSPFGPMRDGQMDELLDHYDEVANEYSTKLLPRAEAIINVHKLACMVYPEAKNVNPMELWDVSVLRNMFATGYVDKLYGGRQKVHQLHQAELSHAECDD